MNQLFRNYLKQAGWFRPARLMRHHRQQRQGHPDWTRILDRDRSEWEAALERSRSGPKVLIATSFGGHLAVTPVESMLAVALTLRGARPEILLCDSALPACMACEVSWYPNQEAFLEFGPKPDLCKECFKPAHHMYQGAGFRVHRYSDWLATADHTRAEEILDETPYASIPALVVDGIAVGEHAMAGTLRFFARGTLDAEQHAESVLRRYLHAALLTTFSTQHLLADHPFETAVFHHGIYVPQGLIGEVARKFHTRVVNWHPAYRKKSFLFSHGDTYHQTLLHEPTSEWENMEWNAELESETLRYLESRWTGHEDWIWFHENPSFDLDELTQDIGVDLQRPCIGLMTNVAWDAQLHYDANAFPDMLSWLFATIEHFRGRPELQLIIRVHPAELRGALPSRQKVVDELRGAFPTLPSNVFVIGPESRLSTYAVMARCDSILIYGTKAGIELTSLGVPVITAGEAFIRNKGITLDAKSSEDYFELLQKLPLGERLVDAELERARKYAFHFFFRRMIPLEFMEPTGAYPPYRIATDSIEPFLPGRSRGLDIICDGILKGTSFVYPAEELLRGV